MNQTLVIVLIAVAVLIVFGFLLLKRKDKSSDSILPQDNYIYGLKAELEGRTEDAFQYYRKCVAEDTNNIDAYLRLGNLLRERGSLDRAYQIHWELSLRKNLSKEQSKEIRFAMVEDLTASKEFQEAGKILRELISDYSKDIDLLQRLLEVYTQTGDWVNAIPTAEKLTKLNGKKFDGRFLSIYKLLEGKSFVERGDFHKARLSYKDALNLDEECSLAYLLIGDAYVADKRLDDAVEWWRRLCEKIPQKSHICFSRLEGALFELGKFGAIAEIYLSIADKDPQNIRALKALAKIQVKMGKASEAVKNLRRVLRINSEDCEAAVELFDLLQQNNDVGGIIQVAKGLCSSSEKKIGVFSCSECGFISTEPEIICPECGKVGSFNI